MQDILATLIAAIAFAVLLRRTVGMFVSKDGAPGCDGCDACPVPAAEPGRPDVAAPVVFLRRSPSHGRR
jgi:hypothetical protein